MNMKLIKFLAAICAGLCLVIASEWLYAIYAQKKLLASLESVNKQNKPVAQLPNIELAKRPESSYTDLVSRPLFIQGRKPVNEPTNEEMTAASTATETFNWALNGVYTYQNKLYALLSRTSAKVPKDNYRKVTKDSDVEGWKLVEIQKDSVIVSQGGKQQELPLRKPKPKDASNNNGNPMVPPPVPNQPGQPLTPEQQSIPAPEPVPAPEQVPEPELIPDETSETYFENE
jgi:hypothetical protein